MAREMKDSGISWVGKIPINWSVQRNKVCFDCSKDIIGEKSAETQLLSLTTKGIKEKRPEDSVGKIPETYDTYQVVFPNDIVMCLFDLDVSAVFSGISPYYGMISPAYKVLKCRREWIIPKYTDYWFSYVFDGRKFKYYSKNLRYTLNYDEFAVLPIILPSIDEQQRISDFLDAECARIDAVIDRTRASIEEYKKLKTGIIDSTILQYENEQNSYLKLGYLGQLKNGLNYKENGAEHRIKFLGVGNFKDYMILNSADMFSEIPIEEISEEYLLQDGDIVFVRSNGSKELVGRSIMVDNIDFPLIYSGFCIRFRNNNPDLVDNRYLLYFFRSEKYRELLKVGSGGTNINNLSQDVLNSIKIPIPSMTHQEEIVATLTNMSTQIGFLLLKKEAFIAELENYKKSLIFEYVTGKKEVLS